MLLWTRMSQEPSHPQQTAEQRREVIARVFLDIREKKYRATGNPVHAVTAFRTARYLRVQIPNGFFSGSMNSSRILTRYRFLGAAGAAVPWRKLRQTIATTPSSIASRVSATAICG
jgi:hypothetical protein